MKGDMFVIAGSMLYAVSNVSEVCFLIKKVFSQHETLLQYPSLSVIPVIAFLKRGVGNG